MNFLFILHPKNMELEFEKPITELEKKLTEMVALAQQNNIDMSTAIKELENKITELKKNIYGNLTNWQRVLLSRHPDRPYTLDYIQNIFTDFYELHGDRLYGDDKAIVGGFAKLEGTTVMIIGQQKGRDTKSRQYRNFGMANPEGYRKALRLMRLAEKFHKPIITFIDTPGAYPGLHAEELGQGEAIAMNIREMFRIRVPIICIIIGEGASGGALGIGVGDKVFMLENTWYSVISPESCSSILWHNWDHKEEAAEALKLTAADNLRLKIIDGIIPEPLGGAHKNPSEVYANVKKTLLEELPKLQKKNISKLLLARIDKFCKMGVFIEK
jgi:acetyl-CoA carboxylase carboxyl transferase subunit alpha